MRSTDTKVTMLEVLGKWSAVLGRPLSQATMDDYAPAGNEDVVLFTCVACNFGQFQPILAGTEAFYEDISAVDYYNADKWEFTTASSDLTAFGATKILDVGCGSGIFLDFLRKRIPEAQLCGYDLNSQLMDQLEAKGYGVIRELPEASSGEVPRFDAICMLQVLEHVADPLQFFQTFLPLLRPGGIIIVTTPNAEGPIRFFQNALTEVPPHHTTRWSERSFRALLSRSGCKVSNVQMEPLPDYLWDSYLPAIWDEPIWPARIFDPIARARGLVTVGERSGFAAQAMKQAGVRWLQDVPGHTIYVSAIRNKG